MGPYGLAQHCTAMTSCPHTIQGLAQMTLGDQGQRTSQRSLEWDKTIFWNLGSRAFLLHCSAQFTRRPALDKMISRGLRTMFSESLKLHVQGVQDFQVMNILIFGLKWVHMIRNGLILGQERVIIWLRIILRPLLTPKWTWTHDNTSQTCLRCLALDSLEKCNLDVWENHVHVEGNSGHARVSTGII